MQVLVLLFLIVPSLYALKCYNYLSSSENKKPAKTWVNCPVEAQYCFKNYSNQKVSSVWMSERTCGTPDLCTKEGCWGTKTNKTCCCRKELCNFSQGTTAVTVVIAMITLFIMKFI